MASATAPGKLRSLGDKIGAIALKVIVEKAVVAALPLALVVAAALRAKIPAVRDVLATRLSVTIWNLVLISFAAAIAIYLVSPIQHYRRRAARRANPEVSGVASQILKELERSASGAMVNSAIYQNWAIVPEAKRAALDELRDLGYVEYTGTRKVPVTRITPEGRDYRYMENARPIP